MKFKVGDKVKVKTRLKADNYYGGQCFNSDMKRLEGQILTIETVNYSDYAVKENTWYWTDEMLTKATIDASEINVNVNDLVDIFKTISEQQAKQNEKTNLTIENMLESVEKSINRVSDVVGRKSIYDDSIVEYILDKVKEIPNEEIHKSIEKKIEKFVNDTYGVLPKKIEIVNNGDIKQIEGIFHSKFEQILKIIKKGVPLMLTGPAGAGKNHTLEQVAKALDLDFYFTNAVTQEYKLTGFIDANGIYQETQFYKA